MSQEILFTDDAAAHLKLSASNLEKRRIDGTGPTYVRLGSRRIGYFRADLDAWLQSRPRHTSTSEYMKKPRRSA
jgi:predicted DNA-binding transcriptional regulator AlpA